MKVRVEQWTIRELVDLDSRNAFFVSPYQRGIVWKPPQMKMLIDSVMRGYGMPMFYLRPDGDKFAVIDGQQRINALSGFVNKNNLVYVHLFKKGEQRQFGPLLDATRAQDMNHFSTFLRGKRCGEWGGKRYADFSEEMREYFLSSTVPVTLLDGFDDDEARDKFIRLQGGFALSRQEKRDAWLGDFCDLVLKTGGKPELDMPGEQEFQGHDFFRTIMGLTPRGDRGRARKMAAQILALFLCREGETRNQFTGINNKDLDKCYRDHVKFTEEAEDAVRQCRAVLNRLFLLFKGKRNIKLRAHEAIHLALFTDMLLDGFSDKWNAGIVGAHNKFKNKIPGNFSEDETIRYADDLRTYYDKIGRSSGDGSVIGERHDIYVRWMSRLLDDDIRAKDPKDPNEPPTGFKELVFYRDKMICHGCRKPVSWENAAVQQVGKLGVNACPLLDNYALVHQRCPRAA